jgi:hypothetical protein
MVGNEAPTDIVHEESVTPGDQEDETIKKEIKKTEIQI